jgi:UDP-N-acetyl-D-mannosaminuronate dehydrogenase
MVFDLCVVSGTDYVGPPLSIVFAFQGLRVLIYDVNGKTLKTLGQGQMRFIEPRCRLLQNYRRDEKELSAYRRRTSAGFAAGLCLLKDTAPLAAFYRTNSASVTPPC